MAVTPSGSRRFRGDRDALLLIARLASVRDLRQLAPSEQESLLGALKRLLTPVRLADLTRRVVLCRQPDFSAEDEAAGQWVGRLLAYPDGSVTESLCDAPASRLSVPSGRFDDDPEGSVLRFLLGGLHADAQQLVAALLAGQFVAVPPEYAHPLRLHGRKIVPYTACEVFAGGVLGLSASLSGASFPFGRCPECGTVFVQLGRGKPRRYCSTRCKSRGIPSARRPRIQSRVHRHRQAQADVLIARRIVREWSKAKQLEKLKKALPHRSKAELETLLAHARSKPPLRP